MPIAVHQVNVAATTQPASRGSRLAAATTQPRVHRDVQRDGERDARRRQVEESGAEQRPVELGVMAERDRVADEDVDVDQHEDVDDAAEDRDPGRGQSGREPPRDPAHRTTQWASSTSLVGPCRPPVRRDDVLDQPQLANRRLVRMPALPAVGDRRQQRRVALDLGDPRLDLGPADTGGPDPKREVDPATVGEAALDPGDHDRGVGRRRERVLRQRTERPDVVTHPERSVQQEHDARDRRGETPAETPAMQPATRLRGTAVEIAHRLIQTRLRRSNPKTARSNWVRACGSSVTFARAAFETADQAAGQTASVTRPPTTSTASTAGPSGSGCSR